MEILLVLVVVGIMISGILPLYVGVIRANKSSEYYSRAYRDIDSQVEKYRKDSFDTLASGTFTVTDLPSGQGTVVVSNVIDGVAQNDIKQVNLTLTWVYRKTNSVKITTYITRNGVGR
jgi:type II secretory pathway pseudopilin PulG